jgi:hypothetical protein
MTAQFRASEGAILDMKLFLITANNQVRVFSSKQEAPTGGAKFGSAEELAAVVRKWPIAHILLFSSLISFPTNQPDNRTRHRSEPQKQERND